MVEKLKPCPFCGGKARCVDFDHPRDVGNPENLGGSCIECTKCQASSAVVFRRREIAYNAWNARVDPVRAVNVSGAVPYVKARVAFLKGRLTSPTVGDEPHFASPQGMARFKELMANTSVYLEYGSGGSTVWASKAGKKVVTVESDAHYLKAVRRKASSNARLIHGDIGLTKLWGAPVFTKRTPARIAKWRAYVEAPWDECQRLGEVPDLVLVDGRFRAASVLKSLLALPPGSQTPILVDDYADREHFHQVEEFADLQTMWGNMAEFRLPTNLDRESCAAAFDRLVQDYR